MAKVSNIRAFIQKWEGGLSRDPNDRASSNPAPWPYKGKDGWHTNKGVTFTTFSSLAPRLGYAVTAENFFTMPDKIWDSIIQAGYWDSWDLDNMNSQAIADLLLDFAWGSGVGGSFNSIKKYLATKNKIVNNRTEAVKALNEISQFNEQTVFLELITWREKFFKSLNQPTFINGWLNRLNDLKNYGLNTIKKKSNGTPYRP
jgi:lysozyme family protein